MTATLSAVAASLGDAPRRGADVELLDVTHDSRQARQGWLFCAIPGTRQDGHDHAPSVVAAGASALLVERWLDLPIPQVRVPSVRAATGPAASVVHGHPSEQMAVIGTTGTNGKTTTSYLVEAAAAAAGQGTGVIGTIEARIHGEAEPGVRTTPEGTDLQRLLRQMCDRGVDVVAMEVSSHGLDLHRVDGTRFAVAVYTNLSQDHLDWHGSMEAYFTAKARLFTPGFASQGVVVLDGPWARRLVAESGIPVTTIGRDADADVRILEETLDIDGGHAEVSWDGQIITVRTRMPGGFNLTNAVTAVVSAVTAGVPLEAALMGVAACPGAPGRLERVGDDTGIRVLVDYAHTPDAVHEVLASLRSLLPSPNQLIIVLGAGGDRDRGKRGPMGASATLADVVVFTSDNPRTEDPSVILDALAAGAQGAIDEGASCEVIIEPDRRAAIRTAIAEADDGDVVLIAGKGHEAIQEFADRTIAFDDREVAREMLHGADA